jgi:uncharacterized membrane protein YdjX (TVP38/TMEM64 family)
LPTETEKETNQSEPTSLTSPDLANRREYHFFLVASVVVLLLTLAFLVYVFLEPVRRGMYQMILQPDRLRPVLDFLGKWSAFIFIAMQTLQVIIVVWPVPLEIFGGFLFGLPLGIFYSTLGLTLGAVLAYFLGGWLEKRILFRLISPETMKHFQRVMKREGALAGFFILLIPGIPKDYVYYFFGFSRVSLPFFLVMATLARLPSTIFLTYQGFQAYKGHYGVTLMFLALYAAVALVFYRYRETFYRWVSGWHGENE